MWGISILAEWGVSFHAVVVFGLVKNLLFKSILGHCGLLIRWIDSFNTVAQNVHIVILLQT